MKLNKNVIIWALYDFANSPYSTIMSTLVFPIYFIEKVAKNDYSILLWAILYGMSEIISALISPPLGALSDITKRKKIFLLSFALLAILGTISCASISQGEIGKAYLSFFFAQLGFSLSLIFYNALIEQISLESERETISGLGWGMGYFGGMFFLILVLIFFDFEAQRFEKNVILFTAFWYFFFSLPFLFFEEKGEGKRLKLDFKESYKEVLNTIKNIKNYQNLLYFMIASFLLNDGVNSAILFGGIFLKVVYGFSFYWLLISFIIFNLIAALGSFVLGPVADKISSKRALSMYSLLWIILLMLIFFLKNKVLLLFTVSLIGILIGTTQSVLRGYLSKLAPKEYLGEWFGFYSLSNKASSLFGPLLFGISHTLTQDLKLSILVLIPLFAISNLLLGKIKNKY